MKNQCEYCGREDTAENLIWINQSMAEEKRGVDLSCMDCRQIIIGAEQYHIVFRVYWELPREFPY